MYRDKTIDFMKTIGIFLVVVGHSTFAYNGYVYTFHMGLFFAISGYLMYGRQVDTMPKVIKKAAKNNLFPYLIFWVLSQLHDQAMSQLWTHGWKQIGVDQIKGLLLGGQWLFDYSSNFPIWYLQMNFLVVILMALIRKSDSKVLKANVFVLCFIATPILQKAMPEKPVWHINVLTAAMVYSLAGYAWAYLVKEQKILEVLSAAWMRLVVGVALIAMGYFVNIGGAIYHIGGYMYFVSSFATILGLYMLGTLVKKGMVSGFVGDKTLYILGLHMMVFSIAIVTDRFLVPLGEPGKLIYCVLVTCICCFIGVIFNSLKKKIS